jgi:hemoglobin
MDTLHDILNEADITSLVHNFYAKVREDALLAPVFNERIGNNWPAHLQKMVYFWQTVLLDERKYFGSPFPPHAGLPISHVHFEKWMQLFVATIDELFQGEKAEAAKWRAGKMAELFEIKMAHYRDKGIKNLL